MQKLSIFTQARKYERICRNLKGGTGEGGRSLDFIINSGEGGREASPGILVQQVTPQTWQAFPTLFLEFVAHSYDVFFVFPDVRAVISGNPLSISPGK